MKMGREGEGGAGGGMSLPPPPSPPTPFGTSCRDNCWEPNEPARLARMPLDKAGGGVATAGIAPPLPTVAAPPTASPTPLPRRLGGPGGIEPPPSPATAKAGRGSAPDIGLMGAGSTAVPASPQSLPVPLPLPPTPSALSPVLAVGGAGGIGVTDNRPAAGEMRVADAAVPLAPKVNTEATAELGRCRLGEGGGGDRILVADVADVSAGEVGAGDTRPRTTGRAASSDFLYALAATAAPDGTCVQSYTAAYAPLPSLAWMA